MNWTLTKCKCCEWQDRVHLQASLQRTQHLERSYTLDDCATIQKDLTRTKKWDNRNVIQFNEGKCKMLCLSNNPMHLHMLTTNWKASLHKNTTLSRNTELVCRSPLQIQLYCDSHCLHNKVKFGCRETVNCAYTLQEYVFSNPVFIIFLVPCHVSDYASK